MESMEKSWPSIDGSVDFKLFDFLLIKNPTIDENLDMYNKKEH